MTDQDSSRPAVQDTTRTAANSVTTEIYEAAFTTTGDHPQCGIAIARTLHEARQRLADMLIFCDPGSPATADIVAFHRDETVDHYEGSTGDIFARVNAGVPGPDRHRPTPHQWQHHRCEDCCGGGGAVTVMCLTLADATAIIDHYPSLRPAGRAYTRTWHHAAQLSPGDLFRPEPDRDPHTVTEVHRTRDRSNGPDWITLIDQYAHPYTYRSNEPVPTAIPDPFVGSRAGKEPSR